MESVSNLSPPHDETRLAPNFRHLALLPVDTYWSDHAIAALAQCRKPDICCRRLPQFDYERARRRAGAMTGSSRSPTCGATCRRRSAFPAIIPCVPCERWSRRSCGTSRPSSISSPAKPGRPSIPPGHLLRALLLQVLYSVGSERLRMEQLDYNWRANSFRRRPLTNQLDDPLSELRRVRRRLFGIVDLPFCRNDGVSTKLGQLHT